MVTFRLSQLISNIKQTINSRRFFFKIKKSKFIIKILQTLYRNGCIKFYKNLRFNKILVMVNYPNNLKNILDIKLISKPGRRQYVKLNKLMITRNKLNGFFVISTSKGIFTSTELLIVNNLKISGEILF